MLEIIPGLLTEREFAYFDERSYAALLEVCDDVIATYLQSYMNNPMAESGIVSVMRQYCETTVKSLTFHKVLREKGTLDIIARLSPEAIANSGEDYTDTYNQLKFLEENRRLLLSKVPKRTLDAFQNFCIEVSRVLHLMAEKGEMPFYPDLLDRMDSNRFIFYIPNDKGHNTYASIVVTKENYWVMTLRGIEYRRYCDAHHVAYDRRSLF